MSTVDKLKHYVEAGHEVGVVRGFCIVRLASVALTAALASCASGEVRPPPERHGALTNEYPAAWASLIPSSGPEGCPSLDGRYSDTPDAMEPDDGTPLPRFSLVISHMSKWSPLQGLAGPGWNPIGASQSVVLKQRPDHLRVDFEKAAAPPVTMDYAAEVLPKFNLLYNGPKHLESAVRGYQCGPDTLAFILEISRESVDTYVNPLDDPLQLLVDALLHRYAKGLYSALHAPDDTSTKWVIVKGELAHGSDGSLVLLMITLMEHCTESEDKTMAFCNDQLIGNFWVRYPPITGAGSASAPPPAAAPRASGDGVDSQSNVPVAESSSRSAEDH